MVQPPEDGAEMLVASGRAQFGVSAQGNLADALSGEAPMPVTAVAAVLQHNTAGIISRKGEGMGPPQRHGKPQICHLGPGGGEGRAASGGGV